MPHRRRRVFVDTPKVRRRAGFTVPESADAADVSMRLRERGWTPYALRLEPEQHACGRPRDGLAARSVPLTISPQLRRPQLPASQRSGMALAFN